MSKNIGCGVTYKLCNHVGGDCGDVSKTILSAHKTYQCGEPIYCLPGDHKGFIAGLRRGLGYWETFVWFCSVECYQKVPENKKIKTEN